MNSELQQVIMEQLKVPGKNGLMQTVLDPIIDYRDKAMQKFQQGMERLRAEAIKRKLRARQFK